MRFPEPGEIFADKYRVDALLGSGGFSRVYKATQLDLGREVAIKILQPPIRPMASEAERHEKLRSLTTRFEREARMMSKLRSPHTITMYDYGRTAGGQLFMSIEFVDGVTLSDLIAEQGALAPERVAKILRQLLLSLYEAHQLGMLHRDIKPQNIMVFEHLGQTDQVKLLDFGIVKLVSRESTSELTDLTGDDTLVGTPRYMSPEYIRGEGVTNASDIYSLGLVIYELLVGKRAINVDSSIQIIGKQLEPQSFFLPEDLSDVDPALCAIVNAMLAKDVSQRYADIKQILEDLDARQRDPHAAPPHASALGVPLAHAPTPAPTAAPTPPVTSGEALHDPSGTYTADFQVESSSRVPKLAAALFVVILFAGGLAVALSNISSDTPDAEATGASAASATSPDDEAQIARSDTASAEDTPDATAEEHGGDADAPAEAEEAADPQPPEGDPEPPSTEPDEAPAVKERDARPARKKRTANKKPRKRPEPRPDSRPEKQGKRSAA